MRTRPHSPFVKALKNLRCARCGAKLNPQRRRCTRCSQQVNNRPKKK